MKYYFFPFFFCFFSFLEGSFVYASESQIFTSIYEQIGKVSDEEASLRVASILGTDSELVTKFIETGNLTDEENETLLHVCRFSDAGENTILTKDQEESCLLNILEMWERERQFLRSEKIEFEKSVAFARWWDGEEDSSSDFDIHLKVHSIDRQFFGRNSETIDVPTANRGVQKLFSLEENSFRLSSDLLPFKATGGCEKGEVSLYGGILCLPRFCSDFLCVNITAFPGRSGVSFGTREASLENIILQLEDIANRIQDAKQNVPTRNSNQAHWWSQIFNFDQLSKANITIASRPPPILADFVPPDYESQKKEYSYGRDESGDWYMQEEEQSPEEDNENGETEDKKKREEIWNEIESVRKELEVCGVYNTQCDSGEVFRTLTHDCGFFQSRMLSSGIYKNVDACMEDRITVIKASTVQKEKQRREALMQAKKEFYEGVPDSLNALWNEISTFEKILMGINICKIQEAKYRCGGIKKKCSLE
jgi:hypothetical protein